MKTISCRDAGTNCDYLAKGSSEEEVIREAKRHAKVAHGYDDSMFTPSFENELRKLIRNVGAGTAA